MRFNALKISASILLFAGIFLICCNFAGLFYYRTIKIGNPHILDVRSKRLSVDEFWEEAELKEGENVEQYAERLTKAVSDRVLFVNPESLGFLRPTFFENWILWIYTLSTGYYQWIDVEKAVRYGGGICSHQGLIFNQIMNHKGFMSFILGLNGHILNEVAVNGQLLVYDPDFGISFNKTLKELEKNPELIFKTYIQAGASEEQALAFVKAYSTPEDNWRMRSSEIYGAAGTMQHILEPVSFSMIWIIPLVLILIGIRMKPYRQ